MALKKTRYTKKIQREAKREPGAAIDGASGFASEASLDCLNYYNFILFKPPIVHLY